MVELVQAEDRDVQQLAQAFVRGELSAVNLHKCLSLRSKPIATDLEGDLWGLAFEVGDGEISLVEARRWLANERAPWTEWTE